MAGSHMYPSFISNYDEAEEWCNKVVNNGHDLLFDVDIFDVELEEACHKFKFPTESLNSFLRNVHLKSVKKQTFVIKNKLDNQIIPDYINGQSILSLARQHNFPPALLSRSIIEKVTNVSKKKVTEAMKNPMQRLNSLDNILEQHHSSEEVQCDSLSSTRRICEPFSGEEVFALNHQKNKMTRLAKEVQEAISLDPLYGPRYDRERQIIGTEYEIVLEQTLRSMNIPFETEQELKKKGTSKTPDILLSCPLALKVPKPTNATKGANDYEWKMICWIDSKALFGDVNTHQKSVLPQAEGYVHRFGPGLVLYWFGHAPLDRLDNGHGDVIVKAWNVPEEFMLPTSEVTSVGRSKNL